MQDDGAILNDNDALRESLVWQPDATETDLYVVVVMNSIALMLFLDHEETVASLVARCQA